MSFPPPGAPERETEQVRKARRVRPLRRVPMLLALLALAAACGCGRYPAATAGGGYDGVTAEAHITADNAAALAAVALGVGTGVDAFVGRPTAASAKAGTLGPALPQVLAKNVRESFGVGGGSVLTFDYDVPGPAGGTLRVFGSLWPDGTGALSTAFKDYGRGDGVMLGGTVTYLIKTRDPASGRITQMDIRVADFHVADDLHDLRLDGTIAVDSPTPAQVVNVFDLDGRDEATGTAFRYSDFVLVRTSLLGGGAAASEDVAGEAFCGASGRTIVVTDAPVAWADGLPVGGGPVRLFGADGTVARVVPLADGSAEIAVDADGDGTFEAVDVRAWDTAG